MRIRPFQFLLPAIAISLLLVASFGCSARRTDLHQTLKQNEFRSPEGQPTILAAYQPWFGRPGHINVGYSTDDRTVLERQVTQAKNLGISGFVVNWYGPNHSFEDHSYSLLQQVAAANDFYVAIMYDENAEDVGHSTDDTISDLQYAYDHYLGPNATATTSSYLHYNGRPVIFIFPKGGNTDWNRVRQAVNGWQQQPILLYKDINAQRADDFDGFYAWVHPDGSWASDGKSWGRQYLENFYTKMTSRYPDKIAVGAAWPGFDDRQAAWSRNRRMSSRCGKTFEDSLRMFRRYYDDQHPLPFLLIVTWNDYEEGTAIEKGVGKCS